MFQLQHQQQLRLAQHGGLPQGEERQEDRQEGPGLGAGREKYWEVVSRYFHDKVTVKINKTTELGVFPSKGLSLAYKIWTVHFWTYPLKWFFYYFDTIVPYRLSSHSWH